MPLSEQAQRSKDRGTGTYAAPQLQHRHFAFIAKVISNISSKVARMETCQHFINALQRTNPRFDSDRFREACECEASEYVEAELDVEIAMTTYWLENLREEKRRRIGEAA